ncbi:methyltransferase domain-containing protein [Algibacter sp. L3A6]|uniref:methyltransferase domain-containing protein n=1 Tax=Algibacter sp. L3A6 TaxID=2686366 RepID=UPI00131B9262|nr:methyltransferase domain-containing protein [Algibacter sp. L3A6]
MIKKLRSIILQVLSFTIGNLLVFLFPEKAKKLSEKGMTLVMKNNLSISERLMRNAILNKVESEADNDTLATLHQNFWKNQGSTFFSSTDDSFNSHFLPNCSYMFDLLKQELSKEPTTYTKLVEIGTGNGNVLNYLSSEFPEIESFIGLDLSSDQVKNNKEKFANNDKLEFIASDGLEWVKNYGEHNTIFLTSGGVLEYFTEDQLEVLLKEVFGLGKVYFIAMEPNGLDHDFELNPNSQLYGHERSFSHNYSKLFKNAGFRIWHMSHKDWNEQYIQCLVGAKS